MSWFHECKYNCCACFSTHITFKLSKIVSLCWDTSVGSLKFCNIVSLLSWCSGVITAPQNVLRLSNAQSLRTAFLLLPPEVLEAITLSSDHRTGPLALRWHHGQLKAWDAVERLLSHPWPLMGSVGTVSALPSPVLMSLTTPTKVWIAHLGLRLRFIFGFFCFQVSKSYQLGDAPGLYCLLFFLTLWTQKWGWWYPLTVWIKWSTSKRWVAHWCQWNCQMTEYGGSTHFGIHDTSYLCCLESTAKCHQSHCGLPQSTQISHSHLTPC